MSPLTSYALFVLFGSTAVILQGCSDKKSDSDKTTTSTTSTTTTTTTPPPECTVKNEAIQNVCNCGTAGLCEVGSSCVTDNTCTIATGAECKAASAKLATMKDCTATTDRCVKSETEPCSEDSDTCTCQATKASGASCGNTSGAPFLCETAHECLKANFDGCGNDEANESNCTCKLICGTPQSAGKSCICKAKNSRKTCDTQETCNTMGTDLSTKTAANSICVTSTSVVADGHAADGIKVCLGSAFATICPDKTICTAAGTNESTMCVVAENDSCDGNGTSLKTCADGLTCQKDGGLCESTETAGCTCKNELSFTQHGLSHVLYSKACYTSYISYKRKSATGFLNTDAADTADCRVTITNNANSVSSEFYFEREGRRSLREM